MKILLSLSFAFILFLNVSLVAQTNFCGTPSGVQNILQNIPVGQYKTASNAYVVRIFIHVMRKSDGTGGQTQQEVNTALSILVADYEQHSICFSLLGADEIKNDTYYNQSSFTTDSNGDGKFDNFAINTHTNAIDVYLFANDKLNFGLASNIPGTSLVIGGSGFGSYLASSHVLSHEMGHCLGLFHTFHGSACEPGGCAELVNGNNSSTCGDFVTDTPADPTRIFTCINQTACTWTGCTCSGSPTDANGTAYNPNTHLLMAYTSPNCMQYHTGGQGSRMRDVIANSLLLQSTLVPDNIVLTSLIVNSGQNILYDARNNLTVQTNVSVSTGGKLTLRAGNDIVLLPDFTAQSNSEFYAEINIQCSTINQSNSSKKEDSNQSNPIDSTLIINRNNLILGIFPNPNDGKFTLRVKNQFHIIQIVISDVLGNIVYHSQTINNEQMIDLSGYAQGVYFVKSISSQGEVLSIEKIVLRK